MTAVGTIRSLFDKPATGAIDGVPRAPIFPAPRPLGHFLEFRRDSLGLFLRAQQHGEIVRMKIANITVHMLFDPAATRQVMVDNQTNYDKRTRDYDILRVFLGNGLVTSEGSFWRRQRRIAQPAFHHTRLANLARSMQTAATELADEWMALADGKQEVDIAQAMMAVTLRIAGETLFGVDLTDDSAHLGGAVSDMLTYYDVMYHSLTPLGARLPTAINRRGRRALERLDETVYTIIAERRRAESSGMDLLGMFMDAKDEETGEQMTDGQLRDEVMTMLTAGHETTANALSWSLYLLSKHPIVLRKIQAELDDVLAGKPVQVPQLKQLTYLEQVLTESMRLYPPVWAIARRAIGDDVLSGHHVPAGSYLLISPYCVHRNPHHWQNPEGFDPERWSPERVQLRRERGHSKHAYFPFAAGPRKCIGDHFARMEAMIILATLLSQFEPDLVSHHAVEIEPGVTLRPRNGIKMRLRKRASHAADCPN